MKAPTNRSAYMDELRSILEDALCGRVERSWMSRQHIATINGSEYYADYTEENAPQQIGFQQFGSSNKVCVRYYKDSDGLMIYLNDEYMHCLRFELYKNKTSYAAAVAAWVMNYAC